MHTCCRVPMLCFILVTSSPVHLITGGNAGQHIFRNIVRRIHIRKSNIYPMQIGPPSPPRCKSSSWPQPTPCRWPWFLTVLVLSFSGPCPPLCTANLTRLVSPLHTIKSILCLAPTFRHRFTRYVHPGCRGVLAILVVSRVAQRERWNQTWVYILASPQLVQPRNADYASAHTVKSHQGDANYILISPPSALAISTTILPPPFRLDPMFQRYSHHRSRGPRAI